MHGEGVVSVIHRAVSQLEPTLDDIDLVVLAPEGRVICPPAIVLPKPVQAVQGDHLAVEEGGISRKQQKLII